MQKPAVLALAFLIILGRVPAFFRAMENRQTARYWFLGFVIALSIGCWIRYFLILNTN